MTPTEKATKAIDEGFQWLLAFVAMRLGEEKSPSYELRGAAQEARRAAWQAMSAYGRFKALANGERPSDEHQLDIPGTVSVTVPEPSPRVVALVDAIDKAVDKAISDTFGDIPDGEGAPEPDQEIDDAQQALDEQLGELGVGSELHADTYRDSQRSEVIMADVGHADLSDDARWGVCREADRIMTALKWLAPGCGAEAVKACLCGLEETPAVFPGCKGDGNCPNCAVPFEECQGAEGPLGDQRRAVYGPVAADVVAELRRLELDAGVTNYDAIDDCILIYWKLDGEDGENVAVNLPRALAVLKGLPDGAVQADVLTVLRGLDVRGAEADDQTEAEGVDDEDHAKLRAHNPAPEPGIADVQRELDRCGATQVRIDSIGDDGRTLYLRRLGRGHGEKCAIVSTDAARILGRLADGLGTEAVWGALSPGRGVARGQDLPGRPAGEPPAKRRKTRKPQQVELSGPPAGYDDRQFTGD